MKMTEVSTIDYKASCCDCKNVKTQNWNAWNNLRPPKPDDTHVTGQILVANPGVQAILTYRQPQGANPTILLLDLCLFQQSGIWQQVQTWVVARYDQVPSLEKYKTVEIHCAGKKIVEIDVEDLH